MEFEISRSLIFHRKSDEVTVSCKRDMPVLLPLVFENTVFEIIITNDFKLLQHENFYPPCPRLSHHEATYYGSDILSIYLRQSTS